ncbi:MFS transporter [Thermobifida halotolerans]|uniref:MFS transporter n=1 Tax=Thermobifida halotolerans TaxID=483545 RepID=UPI00311D9088
MLYPVYALLFADSGLSEAQISSLFALWSVTSFTLEVPSGVLADRVSRRLLLAAAPLLAGAGFALWVLLPSYPAFAVGFVLWGAGGALGSGALEALVYEGLAAAGAAHRYPRLIGRSRAVATAAVVVATPLASPVLAAGGYAALGAASVAACVCAAAAGWALPEAPRDRAASDDGDGEAGVLRDALAEVRRAPALLGVLALLSVLSGAEALEEYLPLLARSTGVSDTAVPPLVLLVTAGTAVGQWCAGHATRWAGPALCAAALLLAVGAFSGHPAGMLGVAAAFGVLAWAGVAVETRLQERISDRSRATVTSLAGIGTETVGLLFFAVYGLGSVWAGPGALFAVLAVPFLVVGLLLWRPR